LSLLSHLHFIELSISLPFSSPPPFISLFSSHRKWFLLLSLSSILHAHVEMITRILLPLLWLFYVSSVTYDHHHIDLSRCKTDTRCFGRESCIGGKKELASHNNLVPLTPIDEVSTFCDVILQIRSYSEKKFHIMIQVNASESTQDVSDDGISLIQEEVQFKCQEAGVTTKNPAFTISM
ncbi:hypothetical protein PMAYCL1PPCAC_07647, partial [Pristionchus mayeri]